MGGVSAVAIKADSGRGRIRRHGVVVVGHL